MKKEYDLDEMKGIRFRKHSGSGSQEQKQQRDWKRSDNHHAMIENMERLHEDAMLISPGCRKTIHRPMA
jgi:hypothetical protein